MEGAKNLAPSLSCRSSRLLCAGVASCRKPGTKRRYRIRKALRKVHHNGSVIGVWGRDRATCSIPQSCDTAKLRRWIGAYPHLEQLERTGRSASEYVDVRI